MKTIVVEWYVKSDIPAAVSALRGLAEAVRAESGTLAYLIHTGKTDHPDAAGSVVFIEMYESEEALDPQHLQGEAFTNFVDANGHLFVSGPTGPEFKVLASLDERIAGFIKPGAIP